MSEAAQEAVFYPFGEALDVTQIRVLGALMEKEITTPEQYPLSLNALVTACNQRSSRDPVMDLTERQVRTALDALEALTLVSSLHDGRVPKYEHRARTVLNLRRDETAILCLLLLRGPQTPGELRGRADRLFSFDDLSAVQATLDRLANRTGGSSGESEARRTVPMTTPLTRAMARQPGAREIRFVHLLGEHTNEPLPAPGRAAATATREEIETEVVRLREKVMELDARLTRLEQQGS